MFTGIVEETGIVRNIRKGAKSAVLTIEGKKIFDDLKPGDSVATNGVCLTVTDNKNFSFTADVMNATLLRSSLGSLTAGTRVNLERALAVNGRFGGHIVTGHIDGTGKITSIKNDDIAVWYTVKTTPGIMSYIIEKGSITIDGISLTVAEVMQDGFLVSVIPHTAKETILSEKKIGSIVNIENDIVGKYIKKFTQKNSSITETFLYENGF
ncbi:riboflavin synthase [Anaerocolumna chitinilytica]|uniref:Riboflavin synthase n=1 Tax=Anaerocolumna chitinilytica TaxID=1727145 RepID=A0A7I8DW79_9FIRM|nr:riboflavin synthase [Anaerocolumna chitinilytica]BCK00577.1 riboflavin synthase subunit alpha [Anaerocolumna chitinilytica]